VPRGGGPADLGAGGGNAGQPGALHLGLADVVVEGADLPAELLLLADASAHGLEVQGDEVGARLGQRFCEGVEQRKTPLEQPPVAFAFRVHGLGQFIELMGFLLFRFQRRRCQARECFAAFGWGGFSRRESAPCWALSPSGSIRAGKRSAMKNFPAPVGYCGLPVPKSSDIMALAICPLLGW
jgi:hypothetical protein